MFTDESESEHGL